MLPAQPPAEPLAGLRYGSGVVRARLPQTELVAQPSSTRFRRPTSSGTRLVLRPTRNSNGSSSTRNHRVFLAFNGNRSCSIIRLTTARTAAAGACPQITKSSTLLTISVSNRRA